VGSVGSGRVVGVSAVGGRVGVEVDDDAAQPVNRVATSMTTHILFIAASGKSIQENH
jgi:hypothetical protein